MTALIIILISIAVIIADELDTRKKCRNNRAATQKRVNEFNKAMEQLKRIQETDYRSKL